MLFRSTQGLGVTFDHLRRRPITVQYPYEKLIPSERYRGRICVASWGRAK